MEFEKERASWKEELDQARQEIIEQNDRLTVLSEQLAGRRVCVCVCVCAHVHVCGQKCDLLICTVFMGGSLLPW